MAVKSPVWLVGFLAGVSAACSSASGSAVGPAIVFAANRMPAVDGEIYTLNARGQRTDLSKSPFRDENPLVSPNGKLVAFQSNRSGAAGIYVVGIGGIGLRRLRSPAVDEGPQVAWAPNSGSLALISGVSRLTLSIIAPRRKQRVLARGQLFDPHWSPDSRLVTVSSPGAKNLLAFTTTSKLAWRVHGRLVGWSSTGLVATIGSGSVHIYDETGKTLREFGARSAAWSPDGKRLASLVRGRVEVRSGSGGVVFRKTVAGLAGQHAGLTWADNRRIVIGFDDRLIGVDTNTGKTFHATDRYFDPRSADGYVVDTPKNGTGFAIRVTRLDGSNPRVYAHVPGCYDDGVFVAAVNRLQFVPGRAHSLVYQSYCPEPFASLYAVDPDGSHLTQLTSLQEEEELPRWSPDGSQIAFTRRPAVGDNCKGCPEAIVVANADGSQPRYLTNPPDGVWDDSPSWSPDGTEILFSRSNVSDFGKLLVVPAAGGTPQSLGVSGSKPVWGPSRIAYLDYDTNPTSLWTVNPNGSGRQKVAQGGGSLIPAWSKDGRLAYVYGKGIAILAGGATRKVQLPFRSIDALAWSPDGTRFVLTARKVATAGDDVYTVRTDGTDLQRVTHDLDVFGVSWH